MWHHVTPQSYFYSENTDCKECYLCINKSVKSSVTQPELLKYGILNITFLPPKQTKCPIWKQFHFTITTNESQMEPGILSLISLHFTVSFFTVIFCSRTEMWPGSHQTPWSCTNTGKSSGEKSFIMYKDAQCLLFASRAGLVPVNRVCLKTSTFSYFCFVSPCVSIKLIIIIKQWPHFTHTFIKGLNKAVLCLLHIPPFSSY